MKREPCVDLIKECPRLQAIGGCEASNSMYKYLAVNCKSTCGICQFDDEGGLQTFYFSSSRISNV